MLHISFDLSETEILSSSQYDNNGLDIEESITYNENDESVAITGVWWIV